MTRPLSELPNREGFRFTGILLNGSRLELMTAVWEGASGTDFVFVRPSAPNFAISKVTLSGWLPDCGTCGGRKLVPTGDVSHSLWQPCPECGTKEQR
jgi:hypothetical protein